MSKTRKMILSALLLALTIILSRFLSINTAMLSVGFSFVPMILSAIWLGPKYSATICGLADLIGAILFPFGAYFVGFTISAICRGLIYGFALYKKDRELNNKELLIGLILGCSTVIVIVDVLMNGCWLMITNKEAFLAILGARITVLIIMLPVQIMTIYVIINALKQMTKKYLFN